MIMCYDVPEIWHVTDVIVIFHFGPLFALLPPNSPKRSKFLKNEKIILEIPFYTSVPKIMITCYTFPEICNYCSFWANFCPFTLPPPH